MNNIKGDSYYVEKILNDLSFIIKHMKNTSKEELNSNDLLWDSMMFRLIQISENSKSLTEEYKNTRKEIPWRDISGLRNRIVHDYGNVDIEIVYNTLTEDIPALLTLFEKDN
ncbi:MAG: DUF86 domain-containing protein [Clostridia bacterium]|nr:DUF86 domain-containing protein [Clostridia bacterium]MBQ7897816.1 DUF86 domain-containing protein [Clostridia bacterium]